MSSRRTTPIAGAVLVLLLAAAAAFWGISSRSHALAEVTRETREMAVPVVDSHRAGAGRPAGTARPARDDAGVHRLADLRADERLPEEVVRRHRRARSRRAAAGGDRRARVEPAARTGAGRSLHRRGQCPARAVDGGTLSRPDQVRLGVTPGCRQRERRARSAADGRRLRAGQRPEAPADARVRAHRSAVRRRDHRAQRRCRRADRSGRQRERAVPRRGDAAAARLRQRAGGVLARRTAGRGGRYHAARISRSHLHGTARPDGAVDRRQLAHAADRDRRRQPEGRAAARVLLRGPPEAAPRRRAR